MTIILSGDYQHDDFSGIRGQFGSECRCVEFLNLLEKPVEDLRAKMDLIIVAQARRSVYSHEDILTLKQRFPLTPIVALLGSWCEGETRSGNPAPGTIRVLWHRWNWQFLQFQKQLQTESTSNWHEPFGGSDSVVDQWSMIQPQANSNLVSSVLISARDRATFETHKDICELTGFDASWLEAQETGRGIKASICVVDCNSIAKDLASRMDNIQELASTSIPVLVVSGFPRRYELEMALRHEQVCGVISKPFDAAEINAALIKFAELPKINFDRFAG